MDSSDRSHRVRKRAPNACIRCRQQKIRCSGSAPCTQCTKRNLACTFEDRSQKILVTKGYISDLEQKLASLEHSKDANYQITLRSSGQEQDEVESRHTQIDPPDIGRNSSPPETQSGRTSPEPPLTNDLASGIPHYISDATGKPIYMGTSSNWSFGRRILATAYEKIIQSPLPRENLFFQGQVYKLDWSNSLQPTNNLLDSLPSADFAIYLINAVKFHCGQVFHLFDEAEFMQCFAQYHQRPHEELEKQQIWQIHYLLLLALGKAFVVRIGNGDEPPGADYFIRAMKYLPNIAFVLQDDIEVMELLCCAALYLHSLDFRSAAYNLALRIALDKGLHTNMRSHHIDEHFAQRCRKIWWTVLVLDRQMSALQGVPMAVRDCDISAELPKASEIQTEALQLHITLSKLTADIVTTVYGSTGRLGKEYLINTRTVLKKIADTTDHLNTSFPLILTSGLSRVTAYLHLLHHQCVLLATRPLFFNFFQMRLNTANPNRSCMPHSRSVRALVFMGVESAQQIFNILKALQNEGLLETFLPFDLDSTFTAITVLEMACAMDNSLVEDRSRWLTSAFDILQEMISRGNLVARHLKTDLEQLTSLLDRLPATIARKRRSRENTAQSQDQLADQLLLEEIDWQNGFTTEHLLTVADSLDLDGLDWLSTTTMDMLT